MYGSGGLHMTKTVKRNRSMLTSKRKGFRNKSNNTVYAKDTLVMSFKTKKVSKEKKEEVIANIRRNARKEKVKIILVYVAVFTIIITSFVLILF